MRRLSQQWRLGLWAPHRGGSSHLTLSIFRGAWTQDQSRKKARTGIVQGPTVLRQERPCLCLGSALQSPLVLASLRIKRSPLQ